MITYSAIDIQQAKEVFTACMSFFKMEEPETYARVVSWENLPSDLKVGWIEYTQKCARGRYERIFCKGADYQQIIAKAVLSGYPYQLT